MGSDKGTTTAEFKCGWVYTKGANQEYKDPKGTTYSLMELSPS
jgi:hypothetical protein